jgi:hypothetical protein
MFQRGQYILMESHSQSPPLFNISTSSILINQLDTAVAVTYISKKTCTLLARRGLAAPTPPHEPLDASDLFALPVVKGE